MKEPRISKSRLGRKFPKSRQAIRHYIDDFIKKRSETTVFFNEDKKILDAVSALQIKNLSHFIAAHACAVYMVSEKTPKSFGTKSKNTGAGFYDGTQDKIDRILKTLLEISVYLDKISGADLIDDKIVESHSRLVEAKVAYALVASYKRFVKKGPEYLNTLIESYGRDSAVDILEKLELELKNRGVALAQNKKVLLSAHRRWADREGKRKKNI